MMSVLFVTRIKGSLAYRDIMQRYVNNWNMEMAELFEDVYIEKYRIMQGNSVEKAISR